MSYDLTHELETICQSSVAFCGIGNSDRGDDALGITIVKLLEAKNIPHCYDGGTTPEKVIPILRDGNFDSIIFVDAVDTCSEPGSIVIFDMCELISKYPQVSTHKLSLGTLAKLATDGNNCRVWLLGIQPESIHFSNNGLSDVVEKSVTFLTLHIATIIQASSYALQEQVCN